MLHKLYLLIWFTALAVFVACSVDDADDEIIMPGNNSRSNSSSSESEALADSELTYNYSALALYYIYANEELDSIGAYKNKGEKNGYSPNEYEFPDVSYMFDQMKDDYTSYWSPYYMYAIYSWLTEAEAYVGIGAEAKAFGDTLVVSQVYPKSPSEKAGLLVGDTILSIDGSIPKTQEGFVKLIAGNEGDVLEMLVKRDEVNTIRITVSEFLMPSVFLDYEDSIPVVRISEFKDVTVSDSGSYGEWMNILDQIKEEKSVIVDLRGNGGGSIDQCLNMASEFLSEKDTLIIQVEAHGDENFEYQTIDTIQTYAATDGIAKGKYVVFLADGNSASCSEAMMAAVASNIKSPIVGGTSYGKGIGQTYFETPAGGIARTTSIQIFDKDFKSYHKVGFVPDFEITDANKALNKAVELAKEATFKRTAGYGTKNTGHFANALMKSGTTTKNAAPQKADIQSGAYRFHLK
ncbi:MAG: S41 family peptidase [Fibrobacter sp.]|nr:S41 family peptidase [Fibrobacter sp.]